MNSGQTAHLVERAAALLRGGAGFAGDPDNGVEPDNGVRPDNGVGPDNRVEPDNRAEPANDLAMAIPAAPAEPLAIPVPAMPPPPEPRRVEMAALRAAGLTLAGHDRTRIAEEYRITVSRILRALRAAKPHTESSHVLMVTSAKPGEGKSFTALNLAASIAQSRLGEVLLVDMDAKPKSLSGLMGLAAAPGMYNLVVNPALRIEDAMLRTAIAGLSYLPVGSRDITASEPGVSGPVSAMVERLRRRLAHNLIILDCAPCLSISDPSTLASVVDQIVMVVEAEQTQRSELEASLELIRACPNITLVLNKVRFTNSYTFGAYYYYGVEP
jgi:receptor protein-tyrosine kinase